MRVADRAFTSLARAEWRKEAEGLMVRLAACSCSCLGPLQLGLSSHRRLPATPLNGLERSGGYNKAVPVWYLEKSAPFSLK